MDRPETIRQYREYEKVFYDGKTFEEIVADERKKEADAHKYRVDREARVTANLERMDRQLQQMEARNKAKEERVAMEQEKRRKILEDLRQEYGYDIDPNQPQFAQMMKEEEKAKKAERKAKFAEAAAEEESEKAAESV